MREADDLCKGLSDDAKDPMAPDLVKGGLADGEDDESGSEKA